MNKMREYERGREDGLDLARRIVKEDPTIEAGDGAIVYDRKLKSYKTFFTNVVFSIDADNQMSNDAESALRNSAERFSEASKIYQNLKKHLNKNKTEWEKAMEELEKAMKEQVGLYPVIKTLDDGSKVYYMCDHQTLEESQVVFELNGKGWAVSTDGGNTWNAGLLVDGTMITKILNSIGINADWINTGALVVKDTNGDTLFRADIDTGQVYINATTLKITGKDVEEIAQDSAKKYVATVVDGIAKDINTQYFGAYDPDLTNLPAKEWTDAETKDKHVNDLFYNTDTKKLFRFIKDGENYIWEDFQDPEIQKALEDAATAKDTADGKRRVFINTPTPPYDEGDMWVTSMEDGKGKVKICKTARESGTFVSTDWIFPGYVDSNDVQDAIDNYDNSLGQPEIFNKLTDNGKNKGIYIQDGELYINASYILSGVLAGTGNNALQALQSENSSAASNLEELRGENFNSQEILAGVADLRAYLGLSDDDILGLQVDYRNKTFKRLAGATNLTPGTDFDRFSMYGGRRKCNVADDGTISAWFGDESYAEDGSNGQVMVYQPKFYYLVCPVVYDPIDTTGIGYHLRKANYYVSEKPRPGFRLHPAFYDASGKEIDYYLTSAYEGSIYDTSAAAYLLQDEQVMSSAEDKFSSIAGARPASGSSQNLTRTEIEKMAQNRGTNWHGDLIKQISAEQLLMIIEMGVMELQTPIGQGVIALPYTTGDDTASSYAAVTGSTASLGNGTGRAEKTTTYEGGKATEYTVNGKTSICWRGKENFWGNIWKFAYGISIWGNGKMDGGQPYICSDFEFAENKNSGNYEPAGFTVAPKEGYISAMGYSTKFDWLFIASETLGNSSLPVGDYTYLTQNLNGYRIAPLGGGWYNWSVAGAFYWALTNGVGYRARTIGGRLVYIPDRDSDAYTAAVEVWKQKMAA